MALSIQDPQPDLFETAATRSLLDQLFSDSRLYTKSRDYKDLLDFVARLRNFAPFNAMLLQVQKPGLSYAASAHDWSVRFGRRPKEGARPLLILWPCGPVALVYGYNGHRRSSAANEYSVLSSSRDMGVNRRPNLTHHRRRILTRPDG